MAEEDEIRAAALRLLARREYAELELARRLEQRGHGEAEVGAVVRGLVEEGLLSETRFVEAFVHSRRDRGTGPARIQAELRTRGVHDELSAAYLDFGDPQWRELAEAVRRKRFGSAAPQDLKERARQARFLHYRGFTAEQVRGALGGDDD